MLAVVLENNETESIQVLKKENIYCEFPALIWKEFNIKDLFSTLMASLQFVVAAKHDYLMGNFDNS